MKSLKYIFIITLIGLLSSCAKDEEIPMCSLKVDAKVTNITATDVLIEFSFPEDRGVLEAEYLLLYHDDGQPVFIETNSYYQRDNLVYVHDGKFCILKDLNPNTTYKYELVVEEKHSDYSHIINNSSDEFLGGRIALSDPSFTFRTSQPSGSDNILSARMTAVSNSPYSATVTVTWNEKLRPRRGFYDETVYLSEDENGANRAPEVYMRYDYSYDDNSAVMNFENLKPDTKYYVFIRNDFEYTTNVNGYEYSDYLEDVPLQLTPNYFVTPTVEEAIIGDTPTTLEEVFNSESYYIGCLRFNPNLRIVDGSEVSISKNEDGSNSVASCPLSSDPYGGGYLYIYAYNLDPSTEYFVNVKGNFRDDYQGTSYEDTSLPVTSFTTKAVGTKLDISLDMTTSVLYNNGNYTLNFDFDNHLSLVGYCEIEFNQSLWCEYNYYEAKGNWKSYLYGYNSIVPGEYTIKSFKCDTVYYVIDEGYRFPFPLPLHYNPNFIISDSQSTQSTGDATATLIFYTTEFSDKPTVGRGFLYYY